MKTVITLSNKKSKIPKDFQHDDNRYPESLVTYFLKKYTKKGDKVIDIFAGLGTTMIVAEKLGRIPFGIEVDKKRCEFVRTKIKNKNNLICGSCLSINKYQFPMLDFAITSPPYNRIDEENYLSGKRGYAGFLQDLNRVYQQLKPLMRHKAHIILEVANLKGKEITPLAWDVAREISKVFHFEGEIVINWNTRGTNKGKGNYGYGYDHSYALVFQNR